MAACAPAEVVPPAYFRLAGHPLRWRLLRELAISDLRVAELTERVGERQNLVSYHLRALRAAGLVSARRSSADARDTYYRLELATHAELLAGSAASLHPGLRMRPMWPLIDAIPHGVQVLFLCTGNSARSQMAEALMRDATAGAVEVASAGSHPKTLHPNAVRALAVRGIDIAGRGTRHVDEFTGRRFDYVISLCDRVREICPEFPGHPDLIHWSLPDPAAGSGEDEISYPAFERAADELDERIHFLLLQMASTRPER